MVQFQPERKTLSFSRKGDGEPNVSRRNAEKRNGEQGEGAPMEAIQDNGTFQSSEELLRDGVAPQQVMSNLIIGKTLQESTEMAEQLRSAATSVGQKLNVEV